MIPAAHAEATAADGALKPPPAPGAAAVRLLWAHALEQRAAAQPEPVRQLLAARLAALAQDEPPAHDMAPADPADAPPAPARGPLGRLADTLGQGQADGAPAAPLTTSPGQPAPEAAPPELQALQRFRSTWSRLAAEERVQQALAQVPPQAGPLNSSQLVYRALLLMRDTAPEYLQRFVPYVDALLWLDTMQSPSPAQATRAGTRRNAGAGKKR